ncbi:efflux RND transporter periplasmic adaptor subunit [Altererythrobacter indicus]|uniref:Efflux RND transporter periplasmic adaptor subunit n=1 Tax=Altericroceibacterium indicum TaxID=374177 RepID=A0A845ADK6_9SPHN|nr:HlyD family secretion protein [Altericroceibacterium indicum]MXP25268.1 efflux RND transporter periplasmic adaptor subunit [Altericroceibacterium indicum]
MTITKHHIFRSLRIVATLILAIIAALALWHLYNYYTYAPQTRDGKVRADVVSLASDVSGRIDSVAVTDNQIVAKGDILFTVDKARLRNALQSANASVATARATLASAEQEARRYNALEGVVSGQDRDLRRAAAQEARAQLSSAIASRDLAKINLERAEVRSPVNGIVTNFQLRPGAYATAGQPVMALVDRDSFYVAGYFEETKLSQIRPGTRATITLMGEDQPLKGHVVGLSAGIQDSERSASSNSTLAGVNPTFSWVRLAQRVPVRIEIDSIPKGIALVAGRTATVTIDDEQAGKERAQ